VNEFRREITSEVTKIWLCIENKANVNEFKAIVLVRERERDILSQIGKVKKNVNKLMEKLLVVLLPFEKTSNYYNTSRMR